MKINSINSATAFKGYSARPLKSIVVNNSRNLHLYDITRDLIDISRNHDFDVVVAGEEIVEELKRTSEEYCIHSIDCSPWIQDQFLFFRNQLFSEAPDNQFAPELAKRLGIPLRNIDEVNGGNIWVLGNNTILAGEDEDEEKLKRLFQPDKIIKIPQADFHIDLFTRPLKGNDILVADDDLTLTLLQKAFDKLVTTSCKNKFNIVWALSSCISQMKNAKNYNSKYAQTENVIEALGNNGFNVIRVPGRVYQSKDYIGIFNNSLNFLNSIVTEDENGDLVYITNKSKLLHRLGIYPKLARHLGIHFEEIFKELVKDYIKPENIYFLNGGNDKFSNIAEILEQRLGGIHCLTLEIPKN